MQAADPFVVIKLKAGWRFEGAGLAFRHGGRRLWLQVPAGTQLAPALAIDRPNDRPNDRPSAAERELQRFVHLRCGEATKLPEMTALVRGWACVERVDVPLEAV